MSGRSDGLLGDAFDSGASAFGELLDNIMGERNMVGGGSSRSRADTGWQTQPADQLFEPTGLLAGVLGHANQSFEAVEQNIWGGKQGGAFGDFSRFGNKTRAAKTRDGDIPSAGPAPSAAPSGTGAPGAGWGQPSTEQLDAELTGTPLSGMGGTIAQIAAKYGVPVSVAMGILRQESSYGRAPAQGTQFNYGGLKNANGPGFADFGSAAQGLESVISNMGTALYRGKSISQFMQTYAPSTDGNNTNAYINNILTLDHKWGGKSDWNTVVTGAPAQASGGGGGTGGLASLTHTPGTVMQEFGDTDYSSTHEDTYAYAGQFGAHGHTGVDYAVPHGTQTFSPVGGTVTIAGGSGFFKDSAGDGPGRGELRITLDNGQVLILGHMANIGVRVGQRINAGDLVGLSGGSDGDHIHVEYRIPDPSTPSGWRIVDPRTYLSGAGGGTTRQ